VHADWVRDASRILEGALLLRGCVNPPCAVWWRKAAPLALEFLEAGRMRVDLVIDH
jgi:hypothetical protein